MTAWLRSLVSGETDWVEFFLGTRVARAVRGPRPEPVRAEVAPPWD